MYTAFSVIVFVLLAANAAGYVPLATRRWVIARLVLSAPGFAAGLVCAIAARLRFSSLEVYNEWANDAFASFVRPLDIMVALGLVILSASVLTAHSNLKTVICLAASAGMAAFILLYTELFVLMTEGTTHPVSEYIRVCGGASAAMFAAPCAIAEAKRMFMCRRCPHTPTQGT